MSTVKTIEKLAIPEEQKKGFEQAGMFHRVNAMFKIVGSLPETLSDEEVDGIMAMLPEDAATSLTAMFIPRVREGSLAFLRMLSKWLEDAKSAAVEGRKTILVPFCFPPELIHAFDNACPVTSEVLSTLGVVALEGQGERYYDMALGLGLPDHICSSNAIEIGSMLGSSDFRPKAIVSASAGSCDINAKTHEVVANYYGIPIFTLEKPTDDTPRGHGQYSKNFFRLVSQLEEFLEEELTGEKLRKVSEKCNRCTELFYELWELHKAVPDPVPNLFSLYTYGIRFAMWGTDEAIACLETLVDVSKSRLKSGAYPAPGEVARCLLTYTSYYFDFAQLFNWMEEKGYTYLGDGLGLLFPEPFDTSSRETMIEAMAKEAWNMPMTRQVGAQSMSMSWLDDVRYACKELKADCAIYSGHHSCKQTWSVTSILSKELMKRDGIPWLSLQGDSWIRRTTPISVIQHDIDEFISNVVTSRPTGRRKLGRKEAREVTS